MAFSQAILLLSLIAPGPRAAISGFGQGTVLDDLALAVKVTFEENATRCKQALADLGDKVGVKLEAAAQMQTPVLVIRAQDVPLKDVMSRIAKVTSGEWKKTDTGFMLYADQVAQRKELNEERTARLVDIRKAVQNMADALKPKPEKAQGGSGKSDAHTEAQMAMAMMMGSQGMSGKAITRILMSIDLTTLAALQEGDRVVYASTPTMMQKQLPGNLGPVFEELIMEHNKAAANKVKDEQVEENAEEKQLREFYESIFGDRKNDNPVTERPAKAMFIASREQFGFGISLELRLYGAGGKVLLSGTSSLPVGGGFMDEAIAFAQEMDPKKQKPATSGDDVEVELSADTKELRSVFGAMGMGGGGAPFEKPLSEGLMNKLTRPDLFDPLSLGPGDSLLGAAKAKNLNVVANLPDEMETFFGMMSEGTKTTANTVINGLTKGNATIGEIKDGWFTVFPAHADQARRERQDRVALTNLISSSRKKGFASLDDIATYALASRPAMDAPVAMTYLMFFAPNAMGNGMMGMTDWNMLRFYGTLGLGQRDTLAAPGVIPFGNTPPNQKSHLGKMAFGTGARLEVEGTDKPKNPGGLMAMVAQFMPRQTGDFREEPTEAMPTGLPNAGTIRCEMTTETVGKPVGGGAIAQMVGVIGADELAMFRYFTEDPKMAQVAGMMPKFDGLRLGTRKVHKFTFTVAPSVSFTKILNDDNVDKNAPLTKMEDLPADMKAKIEQRLAEFKKNPIPFGFGGQETIPPR